MVFDLIGLAGLYVAIGGQYLLLFHLYREITTLSFEVGYCPNHPKRLKNE